MGRGSTGRIVRRAVPGGARRCQGFANRTCSLDADRSFSLRICPASILQRRKMLARIATRVLHAEGKGEAFYRQPRQCCDFPVTRERLALSES